MSKFTYKIAPVSRHVFTMAQYEWNQMTQQQEIVPSSVQNVNLETLNESGLHRALNIIKTRIDPARLGTAAEAWRRLPPSSTVALDVNLRNLFPEKMLRILLQQFMEIWAMESVEGRSWGKIDMNKFKNVPGWPALHSVNPQSVTESQLVMTQRGVHIQPEQCVAKLGELRNKINELAKTLEQCSANNDIACFTAEKDRVVAFANQEMQSKCVTPLKTH